MTQPRRSPTRSSRDAGRAGARVHHIGRAGGLVAARDAARRWACRRPPSATSWRGSRSRATSSSRTPRPAASRPTAATASTSTCCSSRRGRPRRPPPSKRGCAATAADAPLDSTCCSQRVARAVAGVAPRRLRAARRRTRRRCSTRRVRPARRRARARRHRRQRRPGHPEGHRHRRAARRRRAAAGGRTTSTREFSGLPLDEAREAVLERISEERRSTTR